MNNDKKDFNLEKLKLDIKNEKKNLDDSIDSFKSIDNKTAAFLGFYVLVFINFINFIYEQGLHIQCINKIFIVILGLGGMASLIFLILSILPRGISTQVEFSGEDEIFNNDYTLFSFLKDHRKFLKSNINSVENVNSKKSKFLRLAIVFFIVSVIMYILILFI